MNDPKTWMNDWATFVRSVGSLFGDGLDDSAVTARFAGKAVTWTGKLIEKRFHKDRAGVQMEMPKVNLTLPDGRFATVDYLFLKLKEDEIEQWRNVPEGSSVRFTTQISQWLGLFPAIRWDSDEGDNEGVVMFSTDGAAPLGIPK